MKITKELLREWNACTDGYKVFVEMFPEGATLKKAMAGLDKAGHGFESDHEDWSFWLFDKCRLNGLFEKQTSKGYRNSGDWNSGDGNSGDWNSGDWNSGNGNSGYRNSGYRNSGDWNSGYRNSGYRNSGDWNSGYRNSGDWNSGDWNSGNGNSGYWNSGYRNSGDWNSGDWNSGFFNTEAPEEILIFGKTCKRDVWNEYRQPLFLHFSTTVWVSESDMTDEQKAADPDFYVRGGQLQTIDYKKAFKDSWDKSDKADRERIKDCPNFDAEMFYQISGIDLREK